MGRKAPAHVHAEAMLSALLEDRPAGLTIVRLMSATDRTRAQIHTGLAHLRKVVAAKGLPPVTWDKRWGYRMLDGAGGMDRLRTGVLRDRPPPRRELHRRDPPPTPEEDPERPLHPRGHGADGCDRVHPQFLASLAGRSRAPGRRNDRSDAAESFFALLKGEVSTHRRPNRSSARVDICAFVETLCNRRRLTCPRRRDYLTPLETRRRHEQEQANSRRRHQVPRIAGEDTFGATALLVRVGSRD